jgi:MATE family multidrug resistance protein
MSSTNVHYQGLPSNHTLSTNYDSQLENTEDSESTPSFSSSGSQSPNPTIGVYQQSEAPQHLAHLPTETSPLLNHPPVPRIEQNIDYNASADHDNTSTVNMFWEELAVLTKYAIPVFGYAPSFIFFYESSPSNPFYSTQLLEYSLVVVSVVSIGHISTTALAAISLGSMTAGVSGYSVIMGLASALDTVLPSAWTSNEPQLVGLWAQRMGQSINLCGLCHVN